MTDLAEQREAAAGDLLAAALGYMAQGWPVFPVHSADGGRCTCGDPACTDVAKHPRTAHGFKDATTNEEQVRAWWSRWPDANIGMPTGADSGSFVADADTPKNGKANGLGTWAALEKEHGELRTATVLTPSGGYHRHYKHPGAAVKTNKDTLGPGVDTRGDGGYVLLPPSVGANGRRYQWVKNEARAPMPTWMLEKMAQEQPVELPDEFPQNTRHANLRSLAGSMRRKGLTAEEMLPTLLKVNESRAKPKKQRTEVERLAEDIAGRYRPVGDLIDFPYTDLGNARRFVAVWEGMFLHAREENTWLEWRDGRWRRDVTGAAERAAKFVVEALWEQMPTLPEDKRKAAATWAIHSQSLGRLRAMLALASTEPSIVVRLEELDSDPWLLSCGNGTLDLRGGELRAPDPTDLISLGTDIAFVPDAARERWERFLLEVFDGDKDLVAFVKRAYGSCLTGDTRDRALLVEHGARFNGKSTLNGVFQTMLGDFAQTAPIRVVMRGRQSEIPNELARLARKRFVVVSETADGRRLDEAQVKALTGRDKIAARFLHREWFEFKPEFKLVLYTNHRPRVDGSDGAVWDRIRLVPFNISFADREDKELAAKLEQELEGILAWAVEGCLEWAESGLGTCAAVERATQQYRAENDVLGAFLAECCEFAESYAVEKPALRGACEAYFREQGEDPPTPTAITRALTDREVRQARALGKRIYRGVRLVGVEL